MKRELLSAAACALLMASCSNESELIGSAETAGELRTRALMEDADYTIVDGCLYFKNMDSFNNVYFSFDVHTEEPLHDWSKERGYTSLLDKYRMEDNSILNMEEERPLIDTSNRVFDTKSATLFNQKGMMFIADTLYQVKGQYVYIIPNIDETVAENVTNLSAEELSGYKHYAHSIDLKLKNKNTDKTPEVEVAKKRKEWTEFKYKRINIANAQTEVHFQIIGRGKKKGALFWHSFDDELRWGEITCHGITFIGVNGETHYPSGSSGKYYDTKLVGLSSNLGPSDFVHDIEATVTYHFLKNEVIGEQTVTNTYVDK